MKVIADIGSNWNTLDDCLECVRRSKESGIDIVKFQYYTHEKLYGYPGQMKGELPKEWIPAIHDECVKNKIDFMCSVFDPEDVPFIDQFVTIHKIASSENNYRDLFDACEETKKDVLMSMGCKDPLTCYGFIPMACIVEYPTEAYPIEQLVYLIKMGCQEYGLSDHNPSDFGYELAYRFGCAYYEFHFNPLGLDDKPDSPHSKRSFKKKEIKHIELKPGRKMLRVK